MARETQAARALLAYFNRPLVRKLVKFVIDESSPEARKKTANAIIQEVLPKATNEVYAVALEKALAFAKAYTATKAFEKKMEDFVAHNLDHWMRNILDSKIKERAAHEVDRYLKGWDGSSFIKTIPGRLQAEVEREILQQAKAKAQSA
jgi:hypothetical protein